MRDEWHNGMRLLARHANCYCKISGLITETAANGTFDETTPYLDEVLQVSAQTV